MTHQQHATKKGLTLIKYQGRKELWEDGQGKYYSYNLDSRQWETLTLVPA